jgi:hypothetical protein
MDPVSMERGPHAEKLTPLRSSELLTAPYHVELLLSSSIPGSPKRCRLSIEGLTLKDALGIFQEASAHFYTIASRGLSNGDSHD